MPDSVTPISKTSLQSQQPKMEQRNEPSTSGIIENPPPDAAKLSKGIVIEAIVTSGSNRHGYASAVISKAPLPEVIGDEINLKTSAPLKEGAQVTIQITENRTGDLAIRIVQVETPESLARNSASSTPSNQFATTNSPAQAIDESVTLAKQQSVQAVVIKGSSFATTEQQIAQQGIANTPLPNGASLNITIKGIYPQTETTGMANVPNQTTNTNNTSLPQINSTTVNVLPAGASTQAQQNAPILPITSDQHVLQSVAIQQYAKSAQSVNHQIPPQTTNVTQNNAINTVENLSNNSPIPPVPSAPNILSGTIEATNVGGKTIVDIGNDKISLWTNIKASAGSRIDMEVTKVTLPTTTAEQQSTISSLIEPAGGLSSSGWPALGDAMNVLKSYNPIILQSLEKAIPTPGPQLTSTMLSFIKAANTGNLEAWLGSAPLNALRNSGGLGEQIVSRLDNSIKEISKRNKNPSSPTKANFTIPINTDGQGISAISMVVMRNKTSEDEMPTEQVKTEQQNASRFLINVCTSVFGDMQFDGLVFNQNRVLELVIKTRQPLEKQIQQTITGIFTNSLSALDYSGKVVFQVTQTFFTPNQDEALSLDHLDDLTV